ncbi:MAG: polysaccharide deacetylase family protein [Oscillospiraceae bacterium]
MEKKRWRFACIALRGRLIVCLLLALSLLVAVVAAPDSTVAQTNGKAVPIIMYHSILRSPSRAGTYVISPEVVECDLQYLARRGYTTIFVSELADAVITGKQLPERPVILTLDDGYLNNLTYMLPLLEKYDMKAVISIVGAYSEKFTALNDPNPNYAHLTWDDITHLVDSGRIEIGNHSYDMHRQTPRKGTRRLTGESPSAYYEALVADVGKAQSLLEECCGIVPTTFTYPYGHISQESLPILREMGFTAFLTCYERVNYVAGDPAVLLSLGRFNRASGVSTEKFMRKLRICD